MSTQEKSGPAPMDPSVRETSVAAPVANHPRTAYSLETLAQEMTNLFPETSVEFSSVNGFNVALDATFDVFSIDESDREHFVSLLRLVEDDHRIKDVNVEDDHVLVGAWPSMRTQDLREPFDLAAAYLVLTGDEPDYEAEDDDAVDLLDLLNGEDGR